MGTEIQRIWVTERIVCKALAAAYGQSCLRNQKEKHPIGCFFFFIEFVVEPTTEGPEGKADDRCRWQKKGGGLSHRRPSVVNGCETNDG